jgi:hypothetical protein
MRFRSPVCGLGIASLAALAPAAWAAQLNQGFHHTHKHAAQPARALVPARTAARAMPVMTLARPARSHASHTTPLYYVPPVAGRYYPQPFTFPAVSVANDGAPPAAPRPSPLSGVAPLLDPVPQGFADNWGWEPVRSIAELAPRMATRQP